MDLYHSSLWGFKKFMSIKINYTNKRISKSSSNLVIFTDEKFNINKFKKFLTQSDFAYVNEILKTNDLKKNSLVFEINSKKK